MQSLFTDHDTKTWTLAGGILLIVATDVMRRLGQVRLDTHEDSLTTRLLLREQLAALAAVFEQRVNGLTNWYAENVENGTLDGEAVQ